MTTYFQKKFGTYDYTANLNAGDCLSKITPIVIYRGRESVSPGRTGRFTLGPLRDILQFTLSGILVSATPNDDGTGIRAAMDELQAAHDAGPPQAFQLDSDRYALCEVTEFGFEAWDGLPNCIWHAVLQAKDPPYWISYAVTAVALATAGATTFAALGNAPTDTVVTLTVSAAPASSLIAVTNGTKVLTFAPDAAATFVFDSWQETIVSGGTDKRALMTGSFSALQAVPGSNTWTITASGGAALSAAGLTYSARTK